MIFDACYRSSSRGTHDSYSARTSEMAAMSSGKRVLPELDGDSLSLGTRILTHALLSQPVNEIADFFVPFYDVGRVCQAALNLGADIGLSKDSFQASLMGLKQAGKAISFQGVGECLICVRSRSDMRWEFYWVKFPKAPLCPVQIITQELDAFCQENDGGDYSVSVMTSSFAPQIRKQNIKENLACWQNFQTYEKDLVVVLADQVLNALDPHKDAEMFLSRINILENGFLYLPKICKPGFLKSQPQPVPFGDSESFSAIGAYANE